VARINGGPFTELTLLVFARIRMVDAGMLRVRAFAAADTPVPTSASFHLISASSDLPPTWTDSAGPWRDDVGLVRRYFRDNLAARGGCLLFGRSEPAIWGEYLVRVVLPSGALTVDIGIAPLSRAIKEFGMAPASWYLAAVEGLSVHEVRRYTEDVEEADDDREGLEDALGDQSHALLLPDARYEVSVRYRAEVGQKPSDPPIGQDPDEIVVVRSVGSTSALRTFYTDAHPPRSIDPWLLVQFPSPGEGYHFTDDPVVIVFATDDVLDLFAAYDRELRAVARAASFRGSAGTPDAEFTHLLLRPLFMRIGGVVLSPWEATVRRHLMDAPCADFNPDADRHGRVTLPFLLDPLTDYVVDLEALDEHGAVAVPPPVPGAVGERPLHRHDFTTSRYRSRHELAEDVRLALPESLLLDDASALSALSDHTADASFDRALHESGLEVRERPETPRITVFWDDAATAAAIGVLIETPEPVWRTRLEPQPEYDESGEYIVRWVLAPATWLLVDELVTSSAVPVSDGGAFVRRATGVATALAPTVHELRDRFLGPRVPPPPPIPPPPAAIVSRIMHDESGTRTLVMLRPGSRGSTLTLGLARNLHPLLDADSSDDPVVLLELELAGPPWEEV
jgi:hypothetical protein